MKFRCRCAGCCGSQEARLERAEGAELKRQLREALADLESDRSSQARMARNNLQVWSVVVVVVVAAVMVAAVVRLSTIGCCGGVMLFSRKMPSSQYLEQVRLTAPGNGTCK